MNKIPDWAISFDLAAYANGAKVRNRMGRDIVSLMARKRRKGFDYLVMEHGLKMHKVFTNIINGRYYSAVESGYDLFLVKDGHD